MVDQKVNQKKLNFLSLNIFSRYNGIEKIQRSKIPIGGQQ
jgi:hypothetical protein